MPPPKLHFLTTTTTTTTTLLLLLTLTVQLPSTDATTTPNLPEFREAPAFRNGRECHQNNPPPPTIHIAMTLDATYLRGSVAGVLSILQHATCPENIIFHFLSAAHHHSTTVPLRRTISTTFPYLNFHLHHFNTHLVSGKISASLRRALDNPLNYARIYLADLIPAPVHRIIYFDSDLIVVDDVAKLWTINLKNHILGAPVYCHANFRSYFNPQFWAHQNFSKTFSSRNPCYFNTGVMVIDLEKWRDGKYTDRLEYWMKIQKRYRIYELGSLPPFLLVFAGNVEEIEHRWNQHGLGGDNLEGLCRDLHPGPVSLLHWSGKGKPWLRLDSRKPCPLDGLWAPYDLFRHKPLFSDS